MERRASIWLCGLLLAACGAAPTARLGGRLAIEVAPPWHPPPCAAGQLAVANHGVTLDLECTDGHRRCSGQLPIAVRGCRARPLAVREMRLYEAGSNRGTEYTFDPLRPLGAGEVFVHRVPVRQAQRYDIEVDLIELDGTPLAPLALSAEVRNPALAAARDRCRECDGEWGRHGLLQLEGCRCRAADAGEECRDGRDCEGLCLYERFEVTQPERPLSCVGESCSYAFAMGVPVGRCSEFVTMFGCHSYLPDGIAERGPFPARSYRASHVCVD